MHQPQACPRWLLTGVLLLVGFLLTTGTLVAQSTPEKTLTNSMGMEFVLIPSGTFKMGSDTGDADERPVHQVTISKAFYMGKYEVTQGQWQAVMGTNPSASPGDANRPVDQQRRHGDGDGNPAQGVDGTDNADGHLAGHGGQDEIQTPRIGCHAADLSWDAEERRDFRCRPVS